MIDIITDKERNLKNLKQIGTPREENKIYIENFAYAKIKENSYKEKRVFVLMGHTERMEGRYATFIEGIIPIKEMDFVGATPRWNNSTWSEVFREIKRLYEDMIIVGWAMDIKGMSLKMTPELERVHREHFGGVHQLLFLLDTLEQDETFYIYKENKLVAKDGFYIYHRARKKEEPIPITVLPESSDKEPTKNYKTIEMWQNESESKREVDLEVDLTENQTNRGGRYRQMMRETELTKQKDNGNIGLAIAVAMLLFVIGVGAYENRDSIFGQKTSIETNVVQEEDSTETGILIEEVEINKNDETMESTETSVDIIPVEVIPGTEQQD